MTDQTNTNPIAALFPENPDSHYAGTVLETSTERSARLGVASQDGIRVLAFQAEQYARYAEETATTVAKTEVARALAESKADEDVRANRRNRNRSYTLVVALMFTFLVPYVVANILHDAPLLKYATGIAIIPDALITLYAYVKRY